jgi:hypothetical protein
VRVVTSSVLCVGLLLSMAGGAASISPASGADQATLAEVRQSTARYHDVRKAEADGYTSTMECAQLPDGSAAMGVHYINFALIDGTLRSDQPEILVYEPTAGGLKLVAVEYMIPAVATSTHPVLFGQPFDGPMPGHGPGQPVHYDLHAWVWRPNPDGIFAEWNPNVACP